MPKPRASRASGRPPPPRAASTVQRARLPLHCRARDRRGRGTCARDRRRSSVARGCRSRARRTRDACGRRCVVTVTSDDASSMRIVALAPGSRSRNAMTSGRATISSENSCSPARPKMMPAAHAWIHAELAFEPGARRALAGELEHQRVHAQVDALDVVRRAGRARCAAARSRRCDGWITMPHANGLYVLNAISKRSPSSSVISFHAHLVEYVCAMPRGASMRFRRGREAVLGHQRGRQPRARGGAWMERLGHRAELLAHADGLRRGDAQRHRRLVDVETQEPRARRGRAQHAGRAGDVPAAIVMLGIDHVACAARDVDAEDQRVDELAAGRPDVLGQRERRRCDRSRRMDDRLEVRVVEVEGMRRDAVDERGARNVDALAAAEHRRLRRRCQLCTAARAASTVGWRAAPIAQPSQFRNVRCASRSTAAENLPDGCLATNSARMRVIGGALVSAATFVLCAISVYEREGPSRARIAPPWGAASGALLLP